MQSDTSSAILTDFKAAFINRCTDSFILHSYKRGLANNLSRMNREKMLNTGTVGDGKDANVVIATSVEDADDVVRTYEEKTMSKFVTAKQKKSFGKELGPAQLNARILWEDVSHRKAEGYRIKYDGIPLMLVGFKVMHCHYGADRHVAAKARYRARKDCGDETYPCKRRKHNLLESKKLGCPAKIRLRELLKFPKYKIYTDTKMNRVESARKLKNDLQSSSNIAFHRRIYIDLPADSEHCNHPVGEDAGSFQRLDRSIVSFIQTQVDSAIETVQDMRFAVTQFVEENLFKGRSPPPETNRRYNPTDQDIRNHMHLGRMRQKAQSSDSIISSLVNFTPISPDNTITAESACTEKDIPAEPSKEQGRGLTSLSPEDSSAALADRQLITWLPLTVHLQVEPEATESMSSDCQRLLKRIQGQTRKICDPVTLHKLHAVLLQLVTHLDSKISEENGCQTQHSGTPFIWPSLRMSELEKQLKKCNRSAKKQKRSLVLCDGPDFSDSDYEVHCETVYHDTDGDLEEEVRPIESASDSGAPLNSYSVPTS